MKIRGLLAGIIVLSFTSAALAGETRYSIDQAQDLAALARTGELNLKINRQDRKVSVDGSAVVKVDIDKYMRVVKEFERYPAFGIESIREVHVVERGPGDLVYVWHNVAASGRESKQYLEFKLEPVLTNTRARGMEWQQVQRRATWTYEEKSQFLSIAGSWYLEPLADGNVYIRYFQQADIASGLPGWLIELVIRNTFINDSKKAYEAFVRAARAS
jgi:hypothetical protein